MVMKKIGKYSYGCVEEGNPLYPYKYAVREGGGEDTVKLPLRGEDKKNCKTPEDAKRLIDKANQKTPAT
ncbi:hypothetical protein AB4332_03725 [Vibrio breoganii]